MINHTVLISGAARSGKDSLCQVFIEKFKRAGILAKRYAFADELKNQINPLTLLNLGINAFTETQKEKELVRPLMIVWGQICRNVDIDFWPKIVAQKIKDDPVPHIAILADCRYPNEADFFEESTLVHISRIDKDGKLFPPYGMDEEKYNPILEAATKNKFVWKNFDSFDKDSYYNGSLFFDKTFSEDQITTWQKDFPRIKI